MSAWLDPKFLGSVYLTLFVIMDPPGIIPIFLALTGARRLALVTPYLDDVQARIVANYQAEGFAVDVLHEGSGVLAAASATACTTRR